MSRLIGIGLAQGCDAWCESRGSSIGLSNLFRFCAFLSMSVQNIKRIKMIPYWIQHAPWRPIEARGGVSMTHMVWDQPHDGHCAVWRHRRLPAAFRIGTASFGVYRESVARDSLLRERVAKRKAAWRCELQSGFSLVVSLLSGRRKTASPSRKLQVPRGKGSFQFPRRILAFKTRLDLCFSADSSVLSTCIK